MSHWYFLKISFAVILSFILLTAQNLRSEKSPPVSCSYSPNAIGGFVPDRICAPVTVTISNFSHTIPGNIPEGTVYSVDWGDGTSDTYTTDDDDQDIVGGFSHIYDNTTDCNYEPVFTVSNACGTDQITGSINIWDDEDLSATLTENGQICEGSTDDYDWMFTDASQWNCFPPIDFGDPNEGDRTIRFVYGTNVANVGNSGHLDSFDDIYLSDKEYATAPTNANKWDEYDTGDFPYYGDIDTYSGEGDATTLWIKITSDVLAAQSLGNNDTAIFEIQMWIWNDCNPYDDPDIGGSPNDNDPFDYDNDPVIYTAYIAIMDAPGPPGGIDETVCIDGLNNGSHIAATNTWGHVNWYADLPSCPQLASPVRLTYLIKEKNPIYKYYANGIQTEGEYYFYTTQNAGGCESPPKEVLLTIVGALDIGDINYGLDDQVCPNEEDLLYYLDEAPETGTEYIWSVPDDWSNLDEQDSSITVDAGSTTGSLYLEVYKQYSKNPRCQSDTITLELTVNPYPEITLSGTDTYCANTTPELDIEGLSGVNNTGPFDVYYTDGDSLFSETSVSISGKTITPAYDPPNGAVTTYTVDSIIDLNTNGCKTAVDDANSSGNITNNAVVTIREDLEADADWMASAIDGPSPVCKDEEDVQYSVKNSGALLNAAAQPVGGTTKYQWNRPSSWVRTAGTYETTVTYDVGDDTDRDVKVKWKYTTSPTCQTPNKDTNIVVYKLPTAKILTPDTVICDGKDAPIRIELTGEENTDWDLKYDINGQTTVNVDSNYVTITVPAASLNYGDNTFELQTIVENWGAGSSCDGTILAGFESIVIQNNQLPTAEITSPNDTMCVGTDVDITVELTGGITTDWEITYAVDSSALDIWNPMPAYPTDDDPTFITIDADDFDEGDNYVKLIGITQDNGQVCSGNILGDSINIYMLPLPTTSVVTPDYLDTCSVLTSRALGGNDPGGDLGEWSLFSGPGTISYGTDSTDRNTTITVDAWGTYEFQWKISNAKCADSSIVTVAYINPGDARAQAGADDNACFPTYTFDADSLGSGYGTWEKKSGPGNVDFNGTENDTAATVTVDQAGDYEFYWSVTLATCGAHLDSIKITFDTIPTLVNIRDTLCEETKSANKVTGIDLTAAASYQDEIDGANGFTFEWFTNAGLTINPGDETSVTAFNNTVYYAEVTDSNGCVNDVSLTFTIQSMPVIQLGVDKAICDGDSTQLDAGAGLSYLWSSTAETSQTIYVSTAGKHYVTVTNANGCENIDSLSITINALPTIDLGVDTAICSDASITFDAGAPYFYEWHDGSVDQTFEADTAGTFSVTITDGNLCESSDDIALTINTIPSIYLGADSAICNGDFYDIGEMGFDSYLWSDASTDPFLTINSSGNYSVTVTDSVACTDEDSYNLTVHSLPTASISVSGDNSICLGESTELSVDLSGTNSPWTFSYYYIGGDTTTISGTSTDPYTITITPAISGPYVYKLDTVSDTKCGNDPSAFSASVTVNALPTISMSLADIADTTLCEGEVASLVFNFTNGEPWDIYYLKDVVAQPILYNKLDGHTETISTAGVYTIDKVVDINGCENTSDDLIEIVVNPKPTATISGDTVICEGQPFDITVDLTGTAPWDVSLELENTDVEDSLGITDDPWIFTTTTGGTYEINDLTDANGCTQSSFPSNATAILKPIPSVQSLQGGDTSVCVGEDGVTYYVNQIGSNTYSWYVPTAFFTAEGVVVTGGGINSTNTFITMSYGDTAFNDTLTMIETKDGCDADPLIVTLEALALPIADAGDDAIICEGASVLIGGSPAASGGSGNYSYDWIPAATLDDNKLANPTATPVATVTYELYVEDDNAGCESDTTDLSKTIITVNELPDKPVASNVTVCFGEAVPNLEATGDGVEWFDSPTLLAGNKVNDGNTFVTGKTVVGIYTYYVTSTTMGCQGDTTVVILTINAIPAAPDTEDEAVCFGDAIPTLDATGDNINWYNDFALSDLKGSGNSLATGETAAATYEYYVTQSVNSCESDGEMSTLTINSVPLEPVASDTTVCFGDDTPDLEAFGTDVKWYSGFTLVENANTFVTGETAAGTYTYTLNQTQNGCTSSNLEVTLTINALPTVASQEATDQTLCNSGDGTILLVASGFPPVNYSIDGGLSYQLSGSFDSLGNGNYPTIVKNGYGCTAFVDTFIVSSGDAPTAPTAYEDATYAEGQAIDSIWAETNNDPSGLFYWYLSPSLDAVVGSGYVFNPLTDVGTTIYYVTEEVGGCESPSAEVSILINPEPDPPVVENHVICFGESNPKIYATGQVGSTIKWYSDPALSNPIWFDDDTLASVLINTTVGVQNFYVTQTVSNVTSDPSSVSLTINAIPDAATADDEAICFGNPTPNLEAVGNNITWYSDIALSDTVETGNIFSTGLTAENTDTTFYMTQYENGCESSGVEVTLNIYDIPDAPDVDDVTYCIGQGTPTLIASGNDIKWYVDSGLDPVVENGVFYNTGQNTVGTYTYYVTETLNGDCESNATIVTLSIYEVPSKPVVQNDTICKGDNNPVLSASGDNVKWYYPNLNTLVDSGNSYTSVYTDAGEYTYLTTQTSDDGCISSDTSLVFVIKESPSYQDTTYKNQSVCNSNDGEIHIISSGATLYSFNGGASFGSSPDTTGLGNGNYPIVVKNALGCEDEGPNVEITDGGGVLSPVPARNAEYCDGDAMDDLTINSIYGNTDSIYWFDDPGLNNLVNIGNTFTPGSSVGEHIYYITETLGGCESPTTNDTVIVYAIPLDPLAEDVDACVGTIIPNLEATGTSLKWYDGNQPSTPLVFSGESFNHGKTAEGTYTYYITQTVDGCSNSYEAVKLYINPVPSAPTVDDLEFCFGTATPDLSATGTDVEWYDDSGLTSLVNSGNDFASGLTTVGTYAYYVTQTTSCTSDHSTVTVTIHPIPSPPTTEDEEVCEGFTVPYLAATGTFVSWYNDDILTDVEYNGNIFVTGESIPAVYTYYVSNTENSCESPASEVSLTIYGTPATPVIVDAEACSNVTIPDLTTTGTNVKWYLDQYLIALVDTGQSLATGRTQPGTYTYYATQTINTCVSAKASGQLEIYSIPVIVSESSTNELACNSGDGTIDIIASPSGLNYSIDGGTIFDLSSAYTLLSAGTYPIVVKDGNGCIVEGSDITITSGDAPSTPSSTGYTICEAEVYPAIPAYPTSGLSGTMIKWYSQADLNDTSWLEDGAELTTATITANAIIGETVYFYVSEVYDPGGAGECKGAARTVEVITTPLPAKPTITDVFVCGDEIIPDLEAFGDGIQWYNAGSSLVNAGNTYTTGLTSGVTSFTVTQTVDGCEGPDTTITLSIGDVPTAVGTEDEEICFNEATPSLDVVEISDIKWYGDNDLTELLFEGTSYTSDVTNVGYYTFYATQTVDGCESPASTFHITIFDVPSKPVAPDVTVCQYEAVPNLTVTGSSVKWYWVGAENPGDPADIVSYLNSFNSGKTIPGTYTYTITQTVNICTSQPDTAILTIHPEPLQPVASDTILCFNDDANVYAAGDNIQWYSNPGLTNLLQTGNTFITGQTAVGFYTYFVTQTQNDCESPYVAQSMTINTLPTITSQDFNNQTFCNSGDGEIEITATGIGTIEYSIDGGTNFFTSGLFTDLTTGTYQVVVRHSNGCTLDGAAIDISAGDSPDAPTATGYTVCEGETLTAITANGSTDGSLYWFTDDALTTVIAANTASFTPPGTLGTVSYYVADSVGGCRSLATEVVVTIDSLPALAIVNDTSVCGNDPVPDLIGSGSNLTWYNDAALTFLVNTGTSYTTGEEDDGTYTYYVTQTSAEGCEGPDADVTLTIVHSPDPLTPDTEEVCEGDANPALSTPGTDVIWYSDAALTDILVSGDSIVSTETNLGAYYYYSTTTENGCESYAATSTLTIKPVPSAPIADDKSICFGDPPPVLTSTGTSVQWYEAGVFQISGNNFNTNPGVTTVGIYRYAVTQTVNGCESLEDSVIFTINLIPAPPASVNVTVCSGDDAILDATGENINWYTHSSLDPYFLEATGSPYETGKTTVGSYPYYVTQTINECESPSKDIVLTVESLPVIISQEATDQTACNSNDGIIEIIATGTGTMNYSIDDSANFYSADSSNIFGLSYYTHEGLFDSLPTGSYQVVVKHGNGCSVAGLALTVGANGAPSAPAAGADAVYCYDAAATPTDLTASAFTGGTLLWYDNALLSYSNQIGTGNSLTPQNIDDTTIIYYVVDSIGGCSSAPSSVEVEIKPVPAAPAVTNPTVCENDIIPDLEATGTNILWYNNTGPSDLVSTGNSFATGQVSSGSYDYFVTQTVDGCESLEATSLLTIDPSPDPVAIGDSIVCSDQTIPNLQATGTAILWYDNAGLTNPSFSSVNPLPTGETAVGNYSYYATQTVGGCESYASQFTLDIKYVPEAPLAEDLAICKPDAATAVLTASGSHIIWYYSDSVVSNNSNHYPGDMGLGVKTFKVTQTYDGCESDSTTVLYAINYIPPAPGAPDLKICSGEDAILTDTTGGISIQWYSHSSLDVSFLVATGFSYNTNKTAVGIYPYYITQTESACESPSATTILTINSLPVIGMQNVVDQEFCDTEDGEIHLSATGLSPMEYSITDPPVFGFDSDFYDLAGGTYQVTVRHNNGCTISGDILTVGAGDAPVAPTASGYTICYVAAGSNITNITASNFSGGEVNWYSDEALTTLHTADNTSMTPDNTVGITNYYVTTTVGGCESPATTITVTIKPLPAVPDVTDVDVCSNDPTPDLEVFGDNITWYTNGGGFIKNGNTLITGEDAVEDHIYRVTQTLDGCEGPFTTITLSILQSPAVVATDDQVICHAEVTPALTTSGTDVKWYDGPDLSTLLGSDTSYTSFETDIGTYFYYATLTDVNTCVSNSSTFSLTIKDVPDAPFADDKSICEGDFPPVLTSTGNSVKWYDYENTHIYSGNNYSTNSITAAGTYNFTVTQTVNECESATESIVFTINVVPDVPLANDLAICSLEDATLTATGEDIKWYNHYSLDISYLEYSGAVYETGFTDANLYPYYVTQTSNDCESEYKYVTLTINSLPVIVSQDTVSQTVCNSADGKIHIVATGISPYNFSIDGGADFTNTSGDFLALGTGNYPVVVKHANGCSIDGDVLEISAGDGPSAPNVSDDQIYCYGDAFTPITAFSTNGAGGQIFWYDNPGMTNLINTGSYYTPEITDQDIVKTYYISEYIDSCTSPAAEVDVTVNPLPAIYNVTGTGSYCEEDNGVEVGLSNSENGIEYQLYLDGIIEGSPLLYGNTGSAIDFGLKTGEGTYTIKASNVNTLCTEDMSGSAIISIDPLPVAYNINDGGSDCYGESGVPIYLSNSEGNTISYQLYRDGEIEGSARLGENGTINFGNFTEAGIYTVIASNTNTGCTKDMNAIATVNINDLPIQFEVTGTGSFCADDNLGLQLGIAGSESGIKYEMYKDGALWDIEYGTGSAFSFGYSTDLGTYTVIATNPTTTCVDSMNSSAVVSEDPLPVVYTLDFVSASEYCADESGVEIELDGSESGVQYQLYMSGSETGPALNGNSLALSFGFKTAGSYTAIATNSTTGCTENMDGNPVIISNPLPGAFTVGGGGSFCTGDLIGKSIDLSGSQNGITYQFFRDGAFVNNMVGTGLAIKQFFTVAGVYTIHAINSTTGCEKEMNSSATISIDPLPLIYDITGTGSYCAGGVGVELSLSNSENLVNYQLYRGVGTVVGPPVAGNTGLSISLGFQTSNDTYYVIATTTTSGCTENMNGTADVVINDLPDQHNVLGGGTDCFGGTGREIYLGSSDLNINYQLYRDGDIVTGSLVSGDTDSITFGNMTIEGVYTVSGINTVTFCVKEMSGSKTVTIYDLPERFDIYQTNSYCSGEDGIEVGLSGSETGVRYQLWDAVPNPIGIPNNGTGNSISFGNQTTINTISYTIIATDSHFCTDSMNGLAIITNDPLPTKYDLNFVDGNYKYCPGENGVELVLSSSESAVNYQLYKNGSASGSPLPGDGAEIQFGTYEFGTYNVIATNAATLCFEDMYNNRTVEIYPEITIYTVTGGGITCAETEIGVEIGLYDTEAGITYYIILDETTEVGTFNGTGQPYNVYFTVKGTYSINAIRDDGSCEQTMANSVEIIINDLPEDIVFSGTAEYCQGDADGASLTLDESEPGVEYTLWYGAEEVETRTGDGTPVTFEGLTVQHSGYYIVADKNGCTLQLTGYGSVNELALPNPTIFTELDPLTGCTPLDVTFTLTNTSDIQTLIWDYGDQAENDTTDGGIKQITHTYTHYGTESLPSTFTLTAISIDGPNGGCQSQKITSFDVNPGVIASFNVTDTVGCEPLQVQFFNQTLRVTEYSWDFGDGNSSASQDPQHIYTTETSDTFFIASLRAESLYGCADSISDTIYVYESPLASFTVPVESIVAPDIIQLINNTEPQYKGEDWSYIWDFDDGNTSTERDPEHEYEWAKIYDISLTAYDEEHNCENTSINSYLVLPKQPEVYFWLDTAVCAPANIIFYIDSCSVGGKSFQWFLPDGSQETDRIIAYRFVEQGEDFEISLKAYAPDGEGDSIASSRIVVAKIDVYDKPYVNFTYEPENTVVFIFTDTVRFTNYSELNAEFIWNFGDGNTSLETHPVHLYEVEGFFDVKLHATNDFGCMDSLIKGPIETKESEKLYFPTVFFPIAGGEQDNTITGERNSSLFYPLIGKGVSEEGYEFAIYNRWGEKVYYTTETNKGWTGYKNGTLVKQGVYVWLVKGKYENERPFGPLTGNVTLLR